MIVKMSKVMLVLLFVAVVFSQQGCVAAIKAYSWNHCPTYEEVLATWAPLDSAHGRIVLYYPYNGRLLPKVWIDGKGVLSEEVYGRRYFTPIVISHLRFVYVDLPPGTYEVACQWGDGPRLPMKASALGGQITYVGMDYIQTPKVVPSAEAKKHLAVLKYGVLGQAVESIELTSPEQARQTGAKLVWGS